jgi:hypothetical protein
MTRLAAQGTDWVTMLQVAARPGTRPAAVGERAGAECESHWHPARAEAVARLRLGAEYPAQQLRPVARPRLATAQVRLAMGLVRQVVSQAG